MEMLFIVSSILLWLIVLFNLILTLALIRRINNTPKLIGTPPSDMLKTGDKAPDFMAETINGEIMTRHSYAGQEQVMVFVSPTCTPCKEQMPKLSNLYPKAKQAGVELTVVSLADAASTKAYIKEVNFTAPILTASQDENPINFAYKVPGTPSYYLIDRDGMIKAGGFFDDKWQKLIAEWNA